MSCPTFFLYRNVFLSFLPLPSEVLGSSPRDTYVGKLKRNYFMHKVHHLFINVLLRCFMHLLQKSTWPYINSPKRCRTLQQIVQEYLYDIITPFHDELQRTVTQNKWSNIKITKLIRYSQTRRVSFGATHLPAHGMGNWLYRSLWT